MQPFKIALPGRQTLLLLSRQQRGQYRFQLAFQPQQYVLALIAKLTQRLPFFRLRQTITLSQQIRRTAEKSTFAKQCCNQLSSGAHTLLTIGTAQITHLQGMLRVNKLPSQCCLLKQ